MLVFQGRLLELVPGPECRPNVAIVVYRVMNDEATAPLKCANVVVACPGKRSSRRTFHRTLSELKEQSGANVQLRDARDETGARLTDEDHGETRAVGFKRWPSSALRL
eukprot:5684318-Amphidinium_carterae.1